MERVNKKTEIINRINLVNAALSYFSRDANFLVCVILHAALAI
jgi:hypothetical protein